jgi:class 3 adenylate cyclase
MLRINLFSVGDLLVLIGLAAMASTLLYRYWRITRRSEDALLASALSFFLAYCLGSFMADNIVPSGTAAATVLQGGERTLFWYRFMYVSATFIAVSVCHFGLRYCESKHLAGSRALWLYVVGALICPLIWSSAFLSEPAQPTTYTSTWLCPWQPHSKGLVSVFVALWLSTNIYVQYLFWGRFRPKIGHVSIDLGSRMVWAGITMWGLTGVIELIITAVGYAGVDPTPPVLGVSMLLLAIGLGEEYTQNERQRKHVTRRFKSYVDPVLVEYVIDHPEQEQFAGEMREMTVVFTDLEGFTSLSERLREGIVPLLNEYLKLMTPLIREHNGYRNKWQGDGMMFFFGAPEKNPDHAVHAAATALKMQEMMLTFNDKLAGRRRLLHDDLPRLVMRTGVSTGTMVVGDAGPEEASDYTAIGPAVNLGARLESANKAMGTRILLSERTISSLPCGFFLVRPIGKLKLMGIAQPEMTFEPLARVCDATEGQKRAAILTAEMVQRFTCADFKGCLQTEAKLISEIGPGKLGEVYRQLSENYLIDPPGSKFTGEIVLTSK